MAAPPARTHRYPVRRNGPIPAVPPPLRSNLQIQKDKVNRKISSKWPVRRHRNTNASRGLNRNMNWCYRLSALQAILHMPKVMNWIMTHNDGKVLMTRDDEGNKVQVANICPMIGAAIQHECMACALKALIQDYWGDDAIPTGNPPNPQPFAVNRPSLRAFNVAADHIVQFRNNTHQDAEFFLIAMLERCRDHVQPQPHDDIWKERYSCLFLTIIDETRSCGQCGFVIPMATVPRHSLLHPLPEFTWRLPLMPVGPGSVVDVVNRYLRTETMDMTTPCTSCGSLSVRREYRIEGAPEYLVLKPGRRVNEFIHVDEFLDLTDCQQIPGCSLRYKLISTLCHHGSLNSGHWAATVQRHPNVYTVNDARVTRQANGRRSLTNNPQRFPGDMRAAVLVYQRQY